MDITTWLPVASVACLIAIFAVAIWYMLGYMFNSATYRERARKELYQAIASILLVVIMGSLVEFMQIAGTSLTGGQAPLEFALNRTNETINEMNSMYDAIYELNMPVEMADNSFISTAGVDTYCGWDLHYLVEKAHALASETSLLIFAANVEFSILQLFEISFAVLFPWGIILRIFRLTRPVGGLLIAIAIGLYIIYPVVYTLSEMTTPAITARPSVSALEPRSVTGATGNAEVLKTGQRAADEADSHYTQMADDLASAKIRVLIYPIISFIITLLVIWVMAPLFGGEIGEIVERVGGII